MLLSNRLANVTKVIRPNAIGRYYQTTYVSSVNLKTQDPSPSAPRYAPTPLLFLSLDEWDNNASSWSYHDYLMNISQ
jgi:hypothetical protein